MNVDDVTQSFEAFEAARSRVHQLEAELSRLERTRRRAGLSVEKRADVERSYRETIRDLSRARAEVPVLFRAMGLELERWRRLKPPPEPTDEK
jgi:hypothetical protein